ncbi:M28 family peptidase [Candidatus Nitronereus thalassa]|uniref:M28 family peptidase n=1 Tax=Candidatus Nitronereus thalassa TaxID=3020898 RepID=A0ABU3K7Z7_9BACT|nr:M28 family peptidase [Candidatus Nitronereus thalassa]MDT7042482.1 M28 family peptidase [Candidatus Nitronereus thalassa]
MKRSWKLTNLPLLPLLLGGLTFFTPPAYPDDGSLTLNPNRMMEDIHALSHPHFDGRQTGTEGDHRSAEFVALRFHELGLTPAGQHHIGPHHEPWGQTGPVTISHIQTPSTLEFSFPGMDKQTPITPIIGTQFLPVLDSPSHHVTAPIVFVGYGISDPARDWDEYEGLNVQNHVVMFLRGKPSHYPLHIQHTEKERLAREKGAVGFITLTGPVLGRYAARRGMGHQPLAFYTNAKDERPLPGVWISGDIGGKLFQAEGWDLNKIQETLNDERVTQSRELNALTYMKWESTQQTGSLINVLGMIPGNDPTLIHETIIVGAHRDHFGQQAGLLFPGADDNASGTAVLLEIARVLQEGPPPRRTILFASFSGEEQNLLGSTLYVRNPARPLNNTVAMINIDHVGIGNGNLTIGVSKMPKDVAKGAAEKSGLSDKVNLYGFFPGGDHVPFANAGIPTIAVVTAGKHSHFHQTSDTHDTIQTDRLETSAQFVLALTKHLANPD